MFASGLHPHDHSGLYAHDFLTQAVTDGGAITTIKDYMRFATEAMEHSLDSFFSERLSDLADIVDPMAPGEEHEKVERVFDLIRRHSDQVRHGYDAMRAANADVRRPITPGSIFDLLESRAHLRPKPDLAAEQVAHDLALAIPIAFQRRIPAHENELNDIIEAQCAPKSKSYRREFPSVWMGLAKAIPDHFDQKFALIIEGKLIKSQGLAAITGQICEDIMKYTDIKVDGVPANILFVVYDLAKKIADAPTFCGDLESKRSGIRVCVIR